MATKTLTVVSFRRGWFTLGKAFSSIKAISYIWDKWGNFSIYIGSWSLSYSLSSWPGSHWEKTMRSKTKRKWVELSGKLKELRMAANTDTWCAWVNSYWVHSLISPQATALPEIPVSFGANPMLSPWHHCSWKYWHDFWGEILKWTAVFLVCVC